MQTIHECGVATPIVLLIAIVGIVAGAIALAVAFAARSPGLRIGVAIGALLIASMPLLAGGLGRALSRNQVDEAALYVADREEAEQLRIQGYSEADACVVLGVMGALVPALLGGIALVIALSRRRESPPRPG